MKKSRDLAIQSQKKIGAITAGWVPVSSHRRLDTQLALFKKKRYTVGNLGLSKHR
jgi:hypothetical protein